MMDGSQDPRERAIIEKARVVMEAKKQLDARAHQMAAREAALAQKEQELYSREVSLGGREQAAGQQAGRGDALSQAREASLSKMEQELQMRDGALAARESQLKDEEGKLEAYRNELIASAQHLVQKEEELSRREAELRPGLDAMKNLGTLKSQMDATARALADKERDVTARSAPLQGQEMELQERGRKLSAREEEVRHIEEHMKERALELQKQGADLNRWKKDLEALANSKSEVERKQVEQAEREKTLEARERTLSDRDVSLRAYEKRLSDTERTLAARSAEIEQSLRNGQQELMRKGDELVALQRQYKERITALHSEADKLSSMPHPAMTESYAVQEQSAKLETERSRSKELEGRLAEEMRKFTELRRDYDSHRQKVSAMEQSLSKAERELSDYEKREGTRVRELEATRQDLLSKARSLMEQEGELKRQAALLRTAGPGAGMGDSQLQAAQEALDRRAAMLDQEVAKVKKMNEDLDLRSSKLKEAAQAVAGRERELSERENALRLASAPAAPELVLAPPQSSPEAPPAPTVSEAEVRESLAQAEALVAACRADGVDTGQVAEQLNMTRELLGEWKLEDALAAARKSIEMARACRGAAETGKTAEMVESARKMVAEVKQLGVQVAEAEGMLDKAVLALQGAQTELAGRLAQEAAQKARDSGDRYTQATESLQRLDTVYREAQGRKPELDFRDVTGTWGEASAAFDKGDYATAAELARRAERKLHELEIAKAAQKAAAPKPPPSKYQCPSCGKVFQVVPPAFRPFDVGCPHCHTVVRISK